MFTSRARPGRGVAALVLGPLFQRGSWLSGGLLLRRHPASSSSAVASYAGAFVMAPGALLAAILLAPLIGTVPAGSRCGAGHPASGGAELAP